MTSVRFCLKWFSLFIRHGGTKLLFIPADQFRLFLILRTERSITLGLSDIAVSELSRDFYIAMKKVNSL